MEIVDGEATTSSHHSTVARRSLKPTERRKMMARFKGTDTKPEIIARKALHAIGCRFRINRKDLPGSPDIVLPGKRIAIFVHGCFWHHHEGCPSAKVPKSKPEFWMAKFQRNRERDVNAVAALEQLGWRVEIIWECEVFQTTLAARLAALTT